jgi:hypothetical protein
MRGTWRAHDFGYLDQFPLADTISKGSPHGIGYQAFVPYQVAIFAMVNFHNRHLYYQEDHELPRRYFKPKYTWQDHKTTPDNKDWSHPLMDVDAYLPRDWLGTPNGENWGKVGVDFYSRG